MKDKKTTISGIVAIVAYAVGWFFPEYKPVLDGITALAISFGFLVARDAEKGG